MITIIFSRWGFEKVRVIWNSHEVILERIEIITYEKPDLKSEFCFVLEKLKEKMLTSDDMDIWVTKFRRGPLSFRRPRLPREFRQHPDRWKNPRPHSREMYPCTCEIDSSDPLSPEFHTSLLSKLPRGILLIFHSAVFGHKIVLFSRREFNDLESYFFFDVWAKVAYYLCMSLHFGLRVQIISHCHGNIKLNAKTKKCLCHGHKYLSQAPE